MCGIRTNWGTGLPDCWRWLLSIQFDSRPLPEDLILTRSLAQIGAELYLGPSAQAEPEALLRE